MSAVADQKSPREAMDTALKNLGRDDCACCECNGIHCMFEHEGHSCGGKKDVQRSAYRGVADLGEGALYCASCEKRFKISRGLYLAEGGQLLHDEADGTAACGPVLRDETHDCPYCGATSGMACYPDCADAKRRHHNRSRQPEYAE